MPTKPRATTRVTLLVEVEVDLEVYGTEDVADLIEGFVQDRVFWPIKTTVVSPKNVEERR